MKNALISMVFVLALLISHCPLGQAQDKVVVVPLGGATGNAQVGDVLAGKTFSNASAKGLTGTRPTVPIAKTGITRSDYPGDDFDLSPHFGESVSPRYPTGIYSGLAGMPDYLTGLYWQSAPTSTIRTWTAAIDYCESYTTGIYGLVIYDDWRLPNVNELLSIIDRGKINPALPDVFTLPANNWFWTSTPYAVGMPTSLIAWAVHMGNGAVNVWDKDLSYYVMCVRGKYKP